MINRKLNMNLKNQNPIYKELLDLNLINKNRLYKISNKTRDKKISVFKDKKTKIIFLEKHVTNENYYSSLKYISNKIKTDKGNLKITEISDDKRRVKQFQNICKNKAVLDYGCGWGGFLKKLKLTKSLSGIELREECFNLIKKSKKKIDIQKKNKFF